MFAARQTPSTGGDALARLIWQDFEHLLAEYYRGQGYHVERHNASRPLQVPKGGIDLRLRRGSETVLVQCKHWDAEEVQLADVNGLLGNMLNEAASRGVFVTRGRYSREAMAFMRRQPRLQLVDGDMLRVMLKLPERADTALAARGERLSAAPRRSATGVPSWLGPALLAFAIAGLLALFVWRTVTRHDAPATPPGSAAEGPPQASAAPSAYGSASAADAVHTLSPVAVQPTAPPALPPLSGASGIVQKAVSPGRPSVSQEIAERERLRQPSEDARHARLHEDGMTVLERSTRELGSHD
ncbi:restriction endonuclease [Luteibacter sp. ME-Dv--P-043b]|uniref:restriction endonuclease n=1 Tax=Luteibacter sp. ME-Dv--P-043b TaxID=3040291 RepID=UPI002555E73A|nr:restriction endonuclease [Luteibacter sp. ME-Dv--P-043b]